MGPAHAVRDSWVRPRRLREPDVLCAVSGGVVRRMAFCPFVMAQAANLCRRQAAYLMCDLEFTSVSMLDTSPPSQVERGKGSLDMV